MVMAEKKHKICLYIRPKVKKGTSFVRIYQQVLRKKKTPPQWENRLSAFSFEIILKTNLEDSQQWIGILQSLPGPRDSLATHRRGTRRRGMQTLAKIFVHFIKKKNFGSPPGDSLQKSWFTFAGNVLEQ